MPGAAPITGIAGFKNHAFSHMHSNKQGGFSEGTVEHDVNAIAGRTFKVHSKNAKGQSFTTTYKRFHVINDDGNKTGEVFAKAIHRSRSFTPGEIIGLILSYLLLTPIGGALIHNAMLSSHEESVPSQTVNHIKVDIDSEGNIKTPDDRPSALQQIIGADIDFKAGSSVDVQVIPDQAQKAGSREVTLTRAADSAQLDELRETNKPESAANACLDRDLKAFNAEIRVVGRADAGAVEAKGSSDLKALPLYLKRFLASATFGGAHAPMQLNTNTRVDSVPVEVIVQDEKGKEHQINGNVQYANAKVKITITEDESGDYKVKQELTQKPDMPGVVFGQRQCTSTVTVSGSPDDNYHINSIKQTTTYTPA